MNKTPVPGLDVTRINAFRRVGENIPNHIKPFCEDSLIHYTGQVKDFNPLDKSSIQFMEISKELVNICKAKIIVTTCGTAGAMFRINLDSHHFSHTIIDEAGYASEPETWIPLCLGGSNSKVILAGDPKQLGPILTSQFADESGLGMSMIERLRGD